jgi:thiamine kinase-like enzyme
MTMPVFSHSDLQAKNILVHNTQAQGSSVKNDFEISVVNWEEAGWYPDYWEYAAMFVGFLWTDDWLKRLEQIVDPWPGQAAVLRMLFQDLCF